MNLWLVSEDCIDLLGACSESSELRRLDRVDSSGRNTLKGDSGCDVWMICHNRFGYGFCLVGFQ